MESEKKKIGWRLPVLIICIVVLLFSGTMLARDLLRYHSERSANRQLAEQVQQEKEVSVSKFAPSGILSQYDALWQQNNDMAGWLFIPGIDFDYPVMYTPDDPEYYLHRAFNKEWAASGTPFIGAGCDPAGSHVIIYGHHMKDGSMFGNLQRYETAEYATEHPAVNFDTLTEEREYKVLGAFYSRVYGENDTNVFRYYRYTDLSQQQDFEDYIAQVKKASLYDTGEEAVFGDKILTLSTCSYHVKDGRFVVVAVSR